MRGHGDPAVGRFDGPVVPYLGVRAGSGRTVSEDTVRCFRQAAERTVPGARAWVDRIEDSDGVDDPGDLRVLHNMTQLAGYLTDRDDVLWK